MSDELPAAAASTVSRRKRSAGSTRFARTTADARARFERAFQTLPPRPHCATCSTRSRASTGSPAGARLKHAVEATARPPIADAGAQRSHSTRRWPRRSSRRIAPARPTRWSGTTRLTWHRRRGRPCAPTCSSTSASGRRPGRRRRHHARRRAPSRRARAWIRRAGAALEALRESDHGAAGASSTKPVRLVVRDGPDDSRPSRARATGTRSSARSRQHPIAGARAPQGQMTDAMLADRRARVERIDVARPGGSQGADRRRASVTSRGCRGCSISI